MSSRRDPGRTTRRTAEQAQQDDDPYLNEAPQTSRQEEPQLWEIQEEGDVDEQEESEAVRRVMRHSAAEFHRDQQAFAEKTGAIAEDDPRYGEVIDGVLRKSRKDWHKLTWNQSPPEDPEDFLSRDMDPQGKGKSRRQQQDFYSQQAQFSSQRSTSTYRQGDGLEGGMSRLNIGSQGPRSGMASGYQQFDQHGASGGQSGYTSAVTQGGQYQSQRMLMSGAHNPRSSQSTSRSKAIGTTAISKPDITVTPPTLPLASQARPQSTSRALPSRPSPSRASSTTATSSSTSTSSRASSRPTARALPDTTSQARPSGLRQFSTPDWGVMQSPISFPSSAQPGASKRIESAPPLLALPAPGGTSRATPSRAGPSNAGTSRAEPSRAAPSRAEPSRAASSTAGRSRALVPTVYSDAGASRAIPSMAAPSRGTPSRAEPSRAALGTAGLSRALVPAGHNNAGPSRASPSTSSLSRALVPASPNSRGGDEEEQDDMASRRKKHLAFLDKVKKGGS